MLHPEQTLWNMMEHHISLYISCIEVPRNDSVEHIRILYGIMEHYRELLNKISPLQYL